MKNGKIGVTTENIFPVIKKFLYSDHEIFLRELISNAVDATQKLKTLSSIGEAKGDLGDVTIRVAADKEKENAHRDRPRRRHDGRGGGQIHQPDRLLGRRGVHGEV